MDATNPADAQISKPSEPSQKRGAVLRSVLLSPAQRSEQARRAALARWSASKDHENDGRLRSRLGRLLKAREEMLAAVVENAVAGIKGAQVKDREKLAAIRAALAELRMELPILEARLERLPVAEPKAKAGSKLETSPLPAEKTVPNYSHIEAADY